MITLWNDLSCSRNIHNIGFLKSKDNTEAKMTVMNHFNPIFGALDNLEFSCIGNHHKLDCYDVIIVIGAVHKGTLLIFNPTLLHFGPKPWGNRSRTVIFFSLSLAPRFQCDIQLHKERVYVIYMLDYNIYST